MVQGIESVMINSENAKELAEFYEKKVGLEKTNEFEAEDGSMGYEFGFKKGPGLLINDHSDVKGQSKDPQRFFVNLEVLDIDKAVAKLEEEKVKVIQETYHVEGYGLVATFEDPDGNYFQLVQVRAGASE